MTADDGRAIVNAAPYLDEWTPMPTPLRTPRKAHLRTTTSAALLLALPLTLAACDSSSEPDAYPSETIEIIVPFSAGGPTDTVTRIVAEVMSAELGQQVIVQNVEGAGGTIGAGEAAAAEPDGYTALLHHIGMSTAPALYDDLNFDPVNDFAPVGLVTDVPMTIISRTGLGPTNLEELVTYIKDNADTITLANAGVGSASNLCGLLIEEAVGVDVQDVPYDGAAPAMTDMLGGQVDIMCDQTTNTTSQIQSGAVDAYAITTPERVDSLPDLPTTAEAGLPELELSVWHGLYLPAETPTEIVDALQAALATALADESVVSQFADLGTVPAPAENATPEALAERLQEQLTLWGDVLQDQQV